MVSWNKTVKKKSQTMIKPVTKQQAGNRNQKYENGARREISKIRLAYSRRGRFEVDNGSAVKCWLLNIAVPLVWVCRMEPMTCRPALLDKEPTSCLPMVG